MKYRLADAARQDLDEIWLYIAQDHVAAADRLVDELVARFRMLADQPGLGRKRDELANSLRSFPVGKYLIFYRPIPRGIEIARILSGYRDLPPLFVID